MKPVKPIQKSKSLGRGSRPNKEKKELEDKEKSPTTFSSGKKYEQNEKKRSGSLSRNDPKKSQESPKKAYSVDRSRPSRENSLARVSKKDVDKNVSSTRGDTLGRRDSDSYSKNDRKKLETNLRRKPSEQKVAKTSQKVKASSKMSKESKPVGQKTNLQIAKSFIQNTPELKSQKVSKSFEVRKDVVEKQIVSSPSHSSKQEIKLEKPRTSTIRKGPPKVESSKSELDENENENSFSKNEIAPSKSEASLSAKSDDERLSYEEDFEDYDSDFEESGTDSFSDTESSGKSTDVEENVADIKLPEQDLLHNSVMYTEASETLINTENRIPEIKQVGKKSFLKMSDRSSLFSDKDAVNSVENKPIKSSRSFINFASAVEQRKKKKFQNKVLKRASDLLEIITLDTISFDILDIPPMKYETYIRTFGKSNSKQANIQTENCEEEEIQTDEIEMINKWTQIPSNDSLGFGGDNVGEIVSETGTWKNLYNSHQMKLSNFLQESSSVILTILDEEFPSFNVQLETKHRSDLFYSDSYFILSPLNFLKGIPVTNIYSSFSPSHYMITIHDRMVNVPSSNTLIDEKGIICIWNIFNSRNPDHILVSNSQPTCGAFGPSGSNVVIAGMVDGSVMLWDLTEINSYSLYGDFSEGVTVRSPTYSTAAILRKESHNSCLVAVQAVHNHGGSDGSERAGGLKSFHVLTLEDAGIMNIWVVVEVLKPDISGLETDLGLAPGGKYTLFRSTSLSLCNINTLQMELKTKVRTFDFRLVPFDSSRMLVTTDAGVVLHVSRHSDTIEPRVFSSELEFPSEVRCIDCSPHNKDLFLVGCSDGSAKLYSINLAHPLMIFIQAAKGDPVILLQWSPMHPAEFCVLSSSSHIHLWNLMKDCVHPIHSYHYQDSRVTSFAFCNIERLLNQTSSGKLLNLLISKENGEIEVHTFQQKITEEEYSKQMQYMENL